MGGAVPILAKSARLTKGSTMNEGYRETTIRIMGTVQVIRTERLPPGTAGRLTAALSGDGASTRPCSVRLIGEGPA